MSGRAPVAARPCDNPVHGHPLPDGLREGSVEAGRRVREGWQVTKCPERGCIRYGWLTPDETDPTGGR